MKEDNSYLPSKYVITFSPKSLMLFLICSFVLGCDGALIGFGTLPVKDLVDMFELVQKGKISEASIIWQKLLPLEEVIFAPPVRNYRARTKYALSLMGVISEKSVYVRPPLLNISQEEKEKIKVALKNAELI